MRSASNRTVALGWDLQRHSAGDIRGNVEPALFGEQAFVLVELLHVGAALEGRAQAEDLVDGAEPAHAKPGAEGAAAGTVIHAARGRREVRVVEVLETLGGESLVANVQRDTEGMVFARFERNGRSDEQLHQVHAPRFAAQ
jgi:hypothetical protein